MSNRDDRAARRRRVRDAERLRSALAARGLRPVYTLFRFEDPESEQRLAAVIADLDMTLADPDLDLLVRRQLEGERALHQALREQCAMSDPTRPQPEAMH